MERVTLNKFHYATAKRFGKGGMLKFDSHETSGVSPGSLQSLNLGTPMYLGFVPNASPEYVPVYFRNRLLYVTCGHTRKIVFHAFREQLEKQKRVF